MQGSSLKQSIHGLVSAALLAVIVLMASSCQRTIEQNVIVDNVLYGIDTIPVYASASEKDRIKTTNQFISTLYSHLYFRPISSAFLAELSLVQLSNGDKGMTNDIIIESFLDDSDVQASLPSNEEMRADPEAFVEQTYLRFFLRNPTAYERYGLADRITDNADMTPEDVIRAFLLSVEYYYY